MAKIELTDNLLQIFTKMSEGNPGALNVTLSLYKEEPNIDPDSFIAGLGTILAMDEMEIYGPDIWVLYKDVCQQSIKHLVALFRGNQLGFIHNSVIKELIVSANKRHAITYPPGLLEMIQERLPEFGKSV